MCIGLPMQVVEPRGTYALCRSGKEMRSVDMTLIGEQPAGTWLLVFLDAAREIVTAEQAEKTRAALQALSLVMQGETSVDHLFADLVGREPELPAHLKAQVKPEANRLAARSKKGDERASDKLHESQ